MLLNAFRRRNQTGTKAAVGVFLWVILSIRNVPTLAQVKNSWPPRRPNVTVASNWSGQVSNKSNATVGFQHSLVNNLWSRSNVSLYNQPTVRPPQQVMYDQRHPNPALNRTSYGQRFLNHSQYSTYGKNALNQTRPAWQQKPFVLQQSNYAPNTQISQKSVDPIKPDYSQNLQFSQGSLNQTRLISSQTPQQLKFPQISIKPSSPQLPNYPQSMQLGQGSLNQTHSVWQQIPATPQFNTSFMNQPAGSRGQIGSTTNSNLYPKLPNSPNNKPTTFLTTTWSVPANQTRLYPELPKPKVPQPSSAASNSNNTPLAPLQPQENSPGPHNWHSGGQAVLSYAPGYYPQPANNSYKNPPNHSANSNPYMTMFNLN